MFVIVCKESRCVQLMCSQDPKTVMALASNVGTNFDIIEFADKTIEEYQGKSLKVINGELIDLGYVLELEKEGKLEGCGDCPSYT
jgi:hypothetical protein